jgi:hypothetical protein
MGRANREFNNFQSALNLASRVIDRLSVFAGNTLGKFVDTTFSQTKESI